MREEWFLKLFYERTWKFTSLDMRGFGANCLDKDTRLQPGGTQ